MRHLKSLARLSAQEWRWLLASAILLPLVDLSIRCFGWNRTVRHFGWLCGASAYPGSASRLNRGSIPADAARIVRIAARYGPFRATCLPQATVLWTLLRRNGLHPDIKIGVRKAGQAVVAHAWVDVDGCSLDDSGEITYVPMRTPRAGVDLVLR